MKEQILKGAFFLSFILVTYALVNFVFLSNPSNLSEDSSNSSSKISETCGPGNASCENSVKQDINKTPNWEVRSISHFGNGKFGITYLAPSRTGGLTDYYAEYFTDCNCKIIDVNYKIAPPL